MTKTKRGGIVPLIFIAPVLVVVSGIANLSQYFTPEYTNVWVAMFIQSALIYSYYLLPFSMIVVCVMLSGRERQNNGMLKMLVLPVDRKKISLAKFGILLFFLFMELFLFLAVFVLAGAGAVRIKGIRETLPVLYLVNWCIKLFLSMIPSLAVMWAVTVWFEKPLFSAGLNLLLVIPGILAANTPLWIVYPYCYSGYLVSCSLHDFTAETNGVVFSPFPFLPCAVWIFGAAMAASVFGFGRRETS